jgi:hypothetical protein
MPGRSGVFKTQRLLLDHAKLLRIAETVANKARISARVGAEALLNLIRIRFKAGGSPKVRNELIKVKTQTT